MSNGIPKRVVVIKDIPSNIVEEAILILKGDVTTQDIKVSREVSRRNIKKDDKFLISEAQSIINEYIKDGKVQVKPSKVPNLNLNITKKRFFVSSVINLALVGSIALLIFIITRMM